MNTTVSIKHCSKVALCCAALIVLAGCGAEVLTVTAIGGQIEAQNAKSAVGHLAYVKEKMGSVTFDQAVQAYRAENGANPPSLDALVPKYLEKMPLKPDGTPYHYNAATGKLSEAPVMGASTQDDQQMLQSIRDAINRYGTATGYYPPTLDALYPGYLAQLPRTSGGEPFIYNNQNGYLALPNQQAARPAAQSAGAPRGGMGGSGPMGEVMTGIGIQQELGNMNSSATSAAQSRARRGANATSNQHTDNQNRVMDQLGL